MTYLIILSIAVVFVAIVYICAVLWLWLVDLNDFRDSMDRAIPFGTTVSIVVGGMLAMIFLLSILFPFPS